MVESGNIAGFHPPLRASCAHRSEDTATHVPTHRDSFRLRLHSSSGRALRVIPRATGQKARSHDPAYCMLPPACRCRGRAGGRRPVARVVGRARAGARRGARLVRGRCRSSPRRPRGLSSSKGRRGCPARSTRGSSRVRRSIRRCLRSGRCSTTRRGARAWRGTGAGPRSSSRWTPWGACSLRRWRLRSSSPRLCRCVARPFWQPRWPRAHRRCSSTIPSLRPLPIEARRLPGSPRAVTRATA